MAAYKDPQEAEAALTSALTPNADSSSQLPSAIKNAASLVPAAPTPPPASPTPSPYYSRYNKAETAADSYLGNFQAPQSVEEIQKSKTAAAQGEIDALKRQEESLLAEQSTINQGRDRATSSVNTLTGLSGSSEANVTANATTAQNQKDNERIKNDIATKIQGVLSDVRTSAAEEARAQRTQATQDATAIAANRTARETEASAHVKTLAEAGTTADGLKATDPAAYQHLAQMVGGEDMLKASFTLNRPQDTILDKKIENGKYIISYQNPLSGKVRLETLDLGIPPGYSKTIDAGDRILAVPDDWDGSPEKLITINKGMTPTQQAANGDDGGDNPQLYSGLSSKTSTAVRSKVSQFKTEPLVTNFQTIQEGKNFVSSLSNTTANPADDQGLIYALAKVLDPGSVVREGEYATAQKYSQSWIAAYGKQVTQALAGTGFLSEQARKNIKATIDSKYSASKTSYDTTLKQYEQGVNNLTGRADGKKFLTDYTTPSSGGSKTLSKDGQSFDASDLSPEEYQQALQDGYIEQ